MKGSELRRLRLHVLELTQRELAERLDMERKVIMRQERRQRVDEWLAVAVNCLARHRGRRRG